MEDRKGEERVSCGPTEILKSLFTIWCCSVGVAVCSEASIGGRGRRIGSGGRQG